MTKRIIAIVTAVLIIAVSVPAFAADQSIPFDIVNRRDPYVCGNPWYSGDLSSAPAIVSDAISRVTAAHPGYLNLLAQIIQDDGMVIDNVADVYITYIPDLEYSLFKINHNANGDYTYLSRPLLADRSVQNMFRVRVRYDSVSSDFDTFTFEQIFSQSTETSRNVSDVTVKSNYFNSSLFSVPWEFDTSAGGTITVPGPNCDGNFSIGIGTYSFAFPASTPIDPGYNGSVNFSLNPGNVLVFERSGGFTGLDPLPVSGTSLPKSLGWLEKTWSTGVSYGPSLSYPSTSTNLTENYLYWNKVPGTQNLWGITTSGTGSIPIQGSNDFYWIVNPIGVYRNSKWVNNPPITITFNPSDFDAVYLTPMINMDGMAYIPETFDPVYKKYKIDFDVDSGDSTYTDTATDTSVPSADANRPGGLNGYDDVEDGAIGETVGGILGILQSGARAIESLVNGARSFFEALNSMYDWLPDDVQTILKASLFLVFVIGVIKVLH